MRLACLSPAVLHSAAVYLDRPTQLAARGVCRALDMAVSTYVRDEALERLARHAADEDSVFFQPPRGTINNTSAKGKKVGLPSLTFAMTISASRKQRSWPPGLCRVPSAQLGSLAAYRGQSRPPGAANTTTGPPRAGGLTAATTSGLAQSRPMDDVFDGLYSGTFDGDVEALELEAFVAAVVTTANTPEAAAAPVNWSTLYELFARGFCQEEHHDGDNGIASCSLSSGRFVAAVWPEASPLVSIVRRWCGELAVSDPREERPSSTLSTRRFTLGSTAG